MKNKEQPRKTKAHSDLGNFDVAVSSFGEIEGTIDIEQINRFLDRNVTDKKLSQKQIDKGAL